MTLRAAAKRLHCGNFVYPLRVRPLLVAVMLLWVAPAAQAACNDVPGPGVDWSGCTKERLVLTRNALPNAKFDRAVLSGTNFSSVDLSGASFLSAELNRTSFRGEPIYATNSCIQPRQRW